MELLWSIIVGLSIPGAMALGWRIGHSDGLSEGRHSGYLQGLDDAYAIHADDEQHDTKEDDRG